LKRKIVTVRVVLASKGVSVMARTFGLLPGSPLAGTRAGSEKPLYLWVSEKYLNSARNWATIDAVVPHSQRAPRRRPMALTWITDDLGAAGLTLDDEATAVLEKVSRLQSGAYPYEPFGAGQRARWLQDGTSVPTPPYTHGTDHPTSYRERSFR
jgi:hypothetical protein